MGLKGNEYYKIRTKDGRETTYTPEELLEKANEYFQWVLENPFKEEQLVSRPWTEYVVDKKGKPVSLPDGSQQRITHTHSIVEINKMRPFTLQGFCNYSEISKQTFLNYEKRDDFVVVTTHVRGIIENHQFEGATAGFLNANIIARKLGLIDKKEIKTDKRVTKYTLSEREARIEKLNKKRKGNVDS